MQQILSSDVILVGFSLLLGGLIGMFWEKSRANNNNDANGGGNNQRDKR
jgi:uncharacterized membrane protein